MVKSDKGLVGRLYGGAKEFGKKAGKRVLPYLLSASILGSGVYGCAGLNPSVEEIRAKRPKSALEQARYDSEFVGSVMQDLSRSDERDYYAGVWSFTKNWMTPVKIKDEFLDSLARYSIVEDRAKVDSLISVYTMGYNTSPTDTISSFEMAIKMGVGICNSKGCIHPEESHIERYFDDLGNRVLLESVRKGPSEDNKKIILSTIGVPTDSRRRNSFMKEKLEGYEIPTYIVDWGDNRGDTYYQSDMLSISGWWKAFGDEVSELRVTSEEDIVKKQKEIRRDLGSFMHSLTQKPVVVGDTVSIMDPGAVDVGIEVILDQSDGNYYPILNLGLKQDYFTVNDTLRLNGAFVVKRLGNDRDPLVMGNIDFLQSLPGFESRRGQGYVSPIQRVLPPIPKELAKGGLSTLVLGLDVSNLKNEHDKRHIGFSVGQGRPDFYIGRGWVATNIKKSDCVGGLVPDVFKVYHPGDSVNFIVTDDPKNTNVDFAHLRFRFLPLDRHGEEEVNVLPFSAVNFPDPSGRFHEQIIDPSYDPISPPEIPFVKGIAIANISPSLSGINAVKVEIPELKKGMYDVYVDWYVPNEDGKMISNTITMIRGIFIDKDKK